MVDQSNQDNNECSRPHGQPGPGCVDEVGDGEAVVQIVVDDERLAGTVVLDLDAAGRLLGVEVLGASDVLRPETLQQAVSATD
jgi:uncharacterized protein YuzE